ncbi:MAG TPA: DNA-binding protein WhiA [Candidatus Baltobacteraceae bacterium]
MSSALSIDTKDALARDVPEASHCREALRHGLLLYGAEGRPGIFATGRLAVARLAKTLFEGTSERSIRKVAQPRFSRAPSFEIDTGIAAAHEMGRRPGARCDRRMELRGAFLACGSLSEPQRGYHLEFVPPTDAAVQRLLALLRAEGREPKLMSRKGRTVVYFKGVDEITQVLSAIGAFSAVLHLEDVRALKETKNRIHRLVNTEAANVDRAVSAAAAQRELIAYIADAYGLRNLSPVLRETAELRLAYPSESLAELGRRCTPPAGKSTINSRLGAIARLAERMRANPATHDTS